MSENYVPFSGNRPSPFVNILPTTVSPCPAMAGEGPPEGVLPGNPGMRYLDILTGLLYMKEAGTQKIGWQLRGKVGQAGVQVIG